MRRDASQVKRGVVGCGKHPSDRVKPEKIAHHDHLGLGLKKQCHFVSLAVKSKPACGFCMNLNSNPTTFLTCLMVLY